MTTEREISAIKLCKKNTWKNSDWLFIWTKKFNLADSIGKYQSIKNSHNTFSLNEHLVFLFLRHWLPSKLNRSNNSRRAWLLFARKKVCVSIALSSEVLPALDAKSSPRPFCNPLDRPARYWKSDWVNSRLWPWCSAFPVRVNRPLSTPSKISFLSLYEICSISE